MFQSLMAFFMPCTTIISKLKKIYGIGLTKAYHLQETCTCTTKLSLAFILTWAPNLAKIFIPKHIIKKSTVFFKSALTNLMGRFSFSSCLEENIQKGNEGCDTDPITSVY